MTDSTAAIESDIERTRNRMGEGIEAIGEKLRPERIKQQAKDAVSRKTREAGASLWRTAKENPVPTAIVALGLTMLFKARSKQRNGGEGVTERAQELAERAGEKVSHVAHDAANKAKRTGSTLQNFFERNPVIAGAGVVVIGAAVGALLPTTEKENEIMGHARDELVQQAKGVASQAQDTLNEKLSESSARGGSYGTR